MRVERTQNTPNFGMAYYLKCSQGINNNYYQYYVAQRQVHLYANLQSGVCARGYQQFQKEMAKLSLYDVAFDYGTKSMQVIKKATNEVVASFDKTSKWQKGINNPKKKWSPFKAIYAYVADPKQFLPYNMLQAGEKAKQLERQALENI